MLLQKSSNTKDIKFSFYIINLKKILFNKFDKFIKILFIYLLYFIIIYYLSGKFIIKHLFKKYKFF